jgi:hypothetical protein
VPSKLQLNARVAPKLKSRVDADAEAAPTCTKDEIVGAIITSFFRANRKPARLAIYKAFRAKFRRRRRRVVLVS